MKHKIFRNSSRGTGALVHGFLILLVLFIFPAAKAGGMDLIGAGATFPYALYSKMFYVYWQQTGDKINYQAIGSGGGQRQLLSRTVDFGGSDAFMKDADLSRAAGEIIHVPTCLGAVAVTYNLPGSPRLRFTPGLLADIFLGKIVRWNDALIRKMNPDLDLPDMDIVVVHRSEGSGTTFMFTDYLSKVSPEWEKRVGRGKAANWPVGLGSKGNPGVAGMIKYFPGAVGYVELGYALMNGMPVGLLLNRSGRFIEPGPAAATAAANVPLPEDTRITLTDSKAPEGYPISGFTWILAFREQAYKGRSEEKARALRTALWWMVHEGQAYASPLHYAPLPQDARGKAENIIRSMTYHGKTIGP